jgi:hypothetical protein
MDSSLRVESATEASTAGVSSALMMLSSFFTLGSREREGPLLICGEDVIFFLGKSLTSIQSSCSTMS